MVLFLIFKVLSKAFKGLVFRASNGLLADSHDHGCFGNRPFILEQQGKNQFLASGQQLHGYVQMGMRGGLLRRSGCRRVLEKREFHPFATQGINRGASGHEREPGRYGGFVGVIASEQLEVVSNQLQVDRLHQVIDFQICGDLTRANGSLYSRYDKSGRAGQEGLPGRGIATNTGF